MTREDTIIRMSITTYNLIRRNFYQRKNESLESYFKRLAKYLQDLKNPVDEESEAKADLFRKYGE